MPNSRIGDKRPARGPSRRRSVTKTTAPHLSGDRDVRRPADAYEPLVRAAIAGDDAALEKLLVRVQDLAYRFSVTVCGGVDGSDDVMQEALLRTYRRVGQIRDPAAFTPWLYRTVRNACLMSRRRRVDEPAHFQPIEAPDPDGWPGRVLEVADPSPGPEAAAVNVRRRRRLRAALKRLPPQYRVVVLLREVEGLSTREVAATLSLSEANVKQRLHRARLMLQAALVSVDGI